MQPGTSASRQCVLAKAVPLLEQEKRVRFDLLQMEAGPRSQAVILRNHCVKSLAEEFLTQAVIGQNRKCQECQVHGTRADAIEKVLGGLFDDADLHTGELSSEVRQD